MTQRVTQWMCKVDRLDLGQNLERFLDQRGRQGWELVTVLRDGAVWVAFFKAPWNPVPGQD